MSGTRVRQRARRHHAVNQSQRPRPIAPSLPDHLHGDPAAASMALIAARETARFRGMGMSIGGSSVVHAVASTPWFNQTRVPAPACHTGFDPRLDRRTPSRGEITCGNCIRRTRGIDLLTGAPQGQEALFELPLAA